MILPNWVAVKASYKEAKTFYKSLLDSEPCSFVPMHIVALDFLLKICYDKKGDFDEHWRPYCLWL